MFFQMNFEMSFKIERVGTFWALIFHSLVYPMDFACLEDFAIRTFAQDFEQGKVRNAHVVRTRGLHDFSGGTEVARRHTVVLCFGFGVAR